MENELRIIKSDIKSIKKLLRKIREHQEDPTGERAKARSANNGFNKELDISVEFRAFLGLEGEKKISRSQGTKQLTAYVNEKGLKDPNNGRIILLDDKLRKLLNPPDGTVVTFLNLQKYLSPHYLKVEAPPSPSSSSSSNEEKPAAPKKKRVVRKKKEDKK